MSDYFVFYTEANLVCLIIFGIMLAHDLLGVDRQEKQIKYDQALVMFMLYFISDVFWAAVIDGVLPRTRANVAAFNFSNYALMCGITYMWLEYAMAVEQAPHRNRPVNKFAVVFPFLVSTVVLIALYCLAPQLLLDEKLNVQPAYNIFLIAVPCVNIVAVIVYTVRRALVEENPIEKRKHLYIGFFPLMVVGGGILQVALLPNAPIFCFCCAILMLLLYIQSMENQISIDPLTKLNNRGQLIRHISQKSNGYRKDRLTYTVMLDINSFKKVNDTYGHAEGDRALIIVADALREIVRSRSTPIFLSRYGGDEFVLIVHPESEEELTALIAEIRSRIVARCGELETPYVLSVGAGYELLGDAPDSLQKCLQRADEKLYLDKETCKAHAVQQ